MNVLQANVDTLVLENEQLKLEMSELKEKLKEKIETDEFEALEKQTQKDHEVSYWNTKLLPNKTSLENEGKSIVKKVCNIGAYSKNRHDFRKSHWLPRRHEHKIAVCVQTSWAVVEFGF